MATLPDGPNPTLRIREVPSGKLIFEIPLKMKRWENMALSPDFQKLAWTYLDNSVTVVELDSGKETVLNPPTESARGAAVSFSDDGKKVLVTFSKLFRMTAPPRKGGDQQDVWKSDFEVAEWTLEDGKRLQLWKDDEKDRFMYRNLAFAPDGQTRAYIKKKSTERIADFEQEFVLEEAVTRKLRLQLSLKDGADHLMEFSPDGKVLALADEETLRIIDLAQNKVRWTASFKDKIHPPKIRFIVEKWPERLVWLPGGNVGLFFQVGELWTWKTSDGTPATHYTSQATWCLAFARDAPVMVFTQDKRSLQFLDTSTGKKLQAAEGHRNPPNVLFRRDGSLISHDKYRICLWTAGDWRLRNSFKYPDNKQSFSFGPSQDFFVRTVGEKVEMRSLKTGEIIKEWTFQSAPKFVILLSDGKTLAVGTPNQSQDGQFKDARFLVRLLDILKGAMKEIPLPYYPHQIKPSPVKALLALGNGRNAVEILDISSGKLQQLMSDESIEVSLLDFSPDGQKLYFSSTPANYTTIPRPTTLAFVELASGKITKQPLGDDFWASVFSPDGLLIYYSPGKYKFWVTSDRKYGRAEWIPTKEIVVRESASPSIYARFETTGACVHSISCSPDNRYLATGLDDSTILIWDIQGQRKEEKKSE